MSPVRRRVAVVVLAVLGLGLATVAAAGWYAVGEERRTARLVAAVLTSRTGTPITIERAVTDGWRLVLSGVHAAGPAGDVRVSRLDIVGGLLPLLAPSGRGLAVSATATTVTLLPGGAAAPDAAMLDHVRGQLLGLLGWPGDVTLRMGGGDLRAGGRAFTFDLVGGRTAAGGLAFTLAIAPAREPVALQISVRAAAAQARAVDLQVDLAAEPPRLAGLWPPTIPAPLTLASRSEVQLTAGGDLVASGQLTLDTRSPLPARVHYAGGYDGRRGVLTLSRYTLERDDRVRLQGDARVEPRPHGARLVGTAAGTVDDSRVIGDIAYVLRTGEFEGTLSLRPLTAVTAYARLGLGAPPATATARTVHARFSGRDTPATLVATIDAEASGVASPVWRSEALDATLHGVFRFARGARGLGLAAIEGATLVPRRQGAALAAITGGSRGATLFPIQVDARVTDVSRLAPLLPTAPSLAGRARITGEVGRGLTFRGEARAALAHATLRFGAPVTLHAVTAAVPVRWRAGESERAGTVSAERVTGYGFEARAVTSSATFTDGRLLLPDVRYVQYGGQGTGWLEASLDGRPLPFRARLEADDVDLALYVRDSGTTFGSVTGRVRYLLAAQHSRATGPDVSGHLASGSGGGEVGIDAIERLLHSPRVQVETTGVLRQTLENLRTFRYEWLQGEVRVTNGAGRLDLTLKGRKRLGLFPGPVDAINVRNVPLDVLARTVERGSRP